MLNMSWVGTASYFLLCGITASTQINVERNTTSGKVVGFVEMNVEKYLGIPYAAPPVDKLRWKPPQPHPGWKHSKEVLNSTYWRSICPQRDNLAKDIPREEDCLYLNIFVPRTRIMGRFTVMVWIHGGGFYLGFSNTYDGTLLAGNNDVIVVTFNYRVGILGFLNTGDEVATGNYGLLDQRAALQWVRDNIENFGGDKNSVTIFGNSAGSASVLYQAISPMNLGNPKLFQRVIAESGTPLSWWAFQSHPRHHAFELFKNAGCPTNSTAEALDCLRNIPSPQLVALQKTLTTWGEIWTPTVDGSFVTDIPDVMVSSEDLKAKLNGRYKYMIGVNEYDINVGVDEIAEIQDGESFKNVVSNMIKIYFRDPQKMAQVIFDKYVDPLRPPPSAVEWKRLAMKVNRDYLVLSQSVNMSRIASSEDGFNSTSYLYFYVQKFDVALEDSGPEVPYRGLIDGAMHAEEVWTIFGMPQILPHASNENKQLSSQMMSYWCNFAKTGNPSLGRDIPTVWPQFNWETQEYIILGKDEPTDNLTRVADHLETDKVIFWTEELEQYDERKGLDDSVAFHSSDYQISTTTNNLKTMEIHTSSEGLESPLRRDGTIHMIIGVGLILGILFIVTLKS